VRQTCLTWWRDWVIQLGGGYCEPSDEEIIKAPYLLASASLRFTIPGGNCCTPRRHDMRGYDLRDRARQWVAVLVAELNRVVEPVIHAWEMT
jgi:hypothetical protein